MRFEAITHRKGAELEITFGGQHESRPVEMVDVDEFIAVKSHRAKGKRLTTYEVASLRFIEPEEPEVEDEDMLDEEMLGDETVVEGDDTVDEGADEGTDAVTLDMDDIVGADIKADPNVDYNKRDEADTGFGAEQLNLF